MFGASSFFYFFMFMMLRVMSGLESFISRIDFLLFNTIMDFSLTLMMDPFLFTGFFNPRSTGGLGYNSTLWIELLSKLLPVCLLARFLFLSELEPITLEPFPELKLSSIYLLL
jgi:hypothetical protein